MTASLHLPLTSYQAPVIASYAHIFNTSKATGFCPQMANENYELSIAAQGDA